MPSLLGSTLPARDFVGFCGFYDWQSTKSSLRFGGFSASVDLDGSYGFGGRLGYDWGKANLRARWLAPPDAVTLDPQQLSVMGRLSLRFGD